MKAILKNTQLVFMKKHVKEIVYKNYWVRASGQGVNLGSLDGKLESIRLDNIKGIVNAYYNDLSATLEKIFSVRGNSTIGIPVGKTLDYSPGMDLHATFSAFTESKAFEVSFNSSTKEATMDGTTIIASGTGSVSTSMCNFAGIYMADSQTTVSAYTNKTKFARLRLYKADDDTLLCDVRPALVDGVPCLYDSVSDSEFYSVDETALVLE